MSDLHWHDADVLDWAESYDGPKFHAILCDPPYGLSATPDMAEVLAHWLAGDDYEHRGGGFMGKRWDTFVPGPRVWAALRRHCHPGAYLFAFAGTRTADLLGVSIRLGGWEKFDEISVIDWVYGSGFPKSHSIGKAIDEAAGAEREVGGFKEYASGPRPLSHGSDFGIINDDEWQGGKETRERRDTYPATPEAAIWEGHGTGLKPSHEPILCFRNPLATTYAQNCLETGAGALNIDGGRIATNGNKAWGSGNRDSWREAEGRGDRQSHRYGEPDKHPQGRWPANLILSHHPECVQVGTRKVKPLEGHRPNPVNVQSDGNIQFTRKPEGYQKTSYTDPDGMETVEDWECHPDCPVRLLGEQSGELKSGAKDGIYQGWGEGREIYGGSTPYLQHCEASAGTAARFFYQADWSYEIAAQLGAARPFYYCPKASRRERDAGLNDFDHHTGAELCDRQPGTAGLDNPRAGAGRTSGGRNTHPTVKPLSLLKYLATLLLPPAEYAPRRLLVPFCGSGSEAIGAMLAGWDEIEGIDLSDENTQIAQARAAFWFAWREATGIDDPAELLKAARSDELARLKDWENGSRQADDAPLDDLPLFAQNKPKETTE